MSGFFKTIPSYFLKILCLGCLLVLLAVPALAQEQSPKDQGTPPAPSKQPRAMPKKALPPCQEEYKVKEERSPSRETLQQKKVTGKVGGQEIRAKQGEEDK